MAEKKKQNAKNTRKSTKGVKTKTKGNKTPPVKEESGKRKEMAAIVMIALGAFLIVATQTTLAGAFGSIIGDFLKGVYGFGAYFIAYLFIAYAILMLIKIVVPMSGKTAIFLIILFHFMDLINSGRFVADMKYGFLGASIVFNEGKLLLNGGVFGMYAGSGIYQLIGIAGLYIVSIGGCLVFILLLLNTPISQFLEAGKQRKLARKERQKEEEKNRKQKEEERLAEEKELEEKRRLVEEAGRNKEPGYRTPSHRAEALAEVKPVKKEKLQPKMTAKEWKKLPKNKKNILSLMQDEDLFESRQAKDGHGLDGTEPSSIRQPEPPVVVEEESREETFDGFINRKPREEAPPIKEEKEEDLGFKSKSSDFELGGESIATKASETEKKDSEVKVTPESKRRYKLPPMDILMEKKEKKPLKKSGENLTHKAQLLEETLGSFNVSAKVINVISGPSVTRYEIEPARGVKVQSITRLADDLALNMRAKSIRIEAPIPGKAAIGIEIENEDREMVTLREILGSPEFKNHKSKLAFSVGRDIGGHPVVADLGKMPHMLIAGATGSGKSVCINTIIASILYKAKPEEVKLVLIDPKMVELGNYNGIPHLLIPVVTDASKAAAALQWAVAEMTSRYKKFANEKVRDLGTYNTKMKEQGKKEEILPQIVVIIDELADLMMVASSQVEDAICRLAQLARAAGMHLILATQRPSVDVITGLIKANVPSRIAFMVSSQIDSRTIIDMPGAEKLVGNGDMLFKPQDLNKPKRIQGPFVSDEEVHALIEFVKSQSGEPEYNDEIIEQIEKGNGFESNNGGDALLQQAMETVVAAGQASVSLIQRRHHLGYNRAAHLMEIMEEKGIVGPAQGSKPRQVLITQEDLENFKEGI